MLFFIQTVYVGSARNNSEKNFKRSGTKMGGDKARKF